MKHPIALCALLVCWSVLTGCRSSNSGAQAPTAVRTTAKITDFGAVADARTLNTAAIQKTIDQVATTGGTVVIPEGVFLSGSIFLKSGVNLQLDKGAVLKGSTNVSDYPKMNTRIEGHFEPWLPALVNAEGIDGLQIGGEGTLDGSGQPFWTAFRTAIMANRSTKNLDVERPRLMFLQNCRNVTISGISLKDSGFWNLHLYRCRNVLIDGLNITAPANTPSTDGIDIDSSQHVTVRNTFISVNDDCIAIKGSKGPLAMQDRDSPPVEHIRIMDCTFARGHGVLTLGSEATVVRDVIVERCKVIGPETRGNNLVRFKLRSDTPQLYEDIHFRDITLDGAGQLIQMQPWTQYFDLQGHPQPTRHVRNITVSNIKGTFGTFGVIRGNPGDVIEKITLQNIDVQLQNPNPNFTGVKGMLVKDVKVNGQPYTGPQQ